MTKCVFTGIRTDGTETELPAPTEARFDSADDAPADSFQGVFPFAESIGTLVRLRISGADGGELFLGTVDVQRAVVSGEGNLLRLVCRSLAGLLLDSEAVPQTCVFPSLATVFERHVRPYGFSSFLGDASIYREPLRVVKGMSEWQAAAEFCEKFLRVKPRVRGTVFDASGSVESGVLALDSTRGTRYSRAEVRSRLCDRLSMIYAPDGETGVYRLAAEDAETETLGIRRNRCLTKPGTDSAAILEKAERSSFAVYADCPGAPEVAVGAPVSLNDPALGAYNGLTVSQMRCVCGADGLWTSYCLRRD